MQVIVLGMHRSGTSVVGGVLEQMGFYWGDAEMGLPADEDNPKGYWERKDVVDLNDEILRACDARWNGVVSLLQREKELPDSFQSKIQNIINQFNSHTPWFIKDPRLCLTLPLWLQAMTHPLVILVFRHPIQVAKSLNKRDNIPISVGLALWQVYYTQALAYTRDLPKLSIQHDRLMSQPVEVWRQLHDFFCNNNISLSEKLSEEKILDLIDPNLFRQKSDSQLEENFMTTSQCELWRRLSQNDSLLVDEAIALSPRDKEVLEFYGRHIKLEEKFQQLTDESQQTIRILRKQLSDLLKKSEHWIQSLYQVADRLMDSSEYRVGSAFLLKRLRLKKRKRGHLIDQVVARFQEMKNFLK
jgi:hypothetical protein